MPLRDEINSLYITTTITQCYNDTVACKYKGRRQENSLKQLRSQRTRAKIKL